MRAALEVADIFRRHGDAFRTAQRGRLLPDQRRVMAAIEACRTATLGGHVEQCDDCGMVRIAYNSCRDRHCPKCQGLARAQWLADRQADLLPVPYFHVVFTVPAPIAAIALQNKAVVYDILFKAAAETIRFISADPQHLGAETGMIAILHTWGQTLTHHPHAHCVVPGGGLAADGRWVNCRPSFFLPVRVLSRLYRRLFLERLHRQPSIDASWSSSAISQASGNRPPSPGIWSRCAMSNGSSMPSAPSVARSKSSNISGVTPIASRSLTVGSSPARAVASGSVGRIIAPTTSPR